MAIERWRDQLKLTGQVFFDLQLAEDPVEQLAMIADSVSGRLDVERQRLLRREADLESATTDPALNLLIWFNLPKLVYVLPSFRDLGIGDELLVTEGVSLLAQIILDWDPGESGDSTADYLSTRVADRLTKGLKGCVARYYGLSPQDYPLIRLYCQSRQIFEQDWGWEPGMDDLDKLRQIVVEEHQQLSTSPGARRVPPLWPRRVKENDPWQGDRIGRIHSIYCLSRDLFAGEPGEVPSRTDPVGLFRLYYGRDPDGEETESLTESGEIGWEANWTNLVDAATAWESERPVEDATMVAELRRLEDALLGTLSPREARVLRLRYGLEDGKCYTLEEVRKILGLSRERELGGWGRTLYSNFVIRQEGTC